MVDFTHNSDMKRIILLSILFCQALFCLSQNADFQTAVAKYKTATTMTATVTKNSHRAAVKNDVVTTGTLEMKKPAYVCINVNDNKDMLLMEGNQFTMKAGGRKQKTTGEGNPQFATFQGVFEAILAGGGDLSKYSDLTIAKQGQDLVLTITPTAESKKQQRRIMFTSLVLTIDSRTSALKSLRMNEQRGNYTVYQFTNFAFK